MPLYGVDRLIIDRRVRESARVGQILERWDGEPPVYADSVDACVKRATLDADALTKGKRTLLLTERKGPFLTPCQGMTGRHRACCAYRILNIVENCPMDCSYCILLGYLDNPLITAHVNLDGLSGEIDRARPGNGRLLRLGTGELGDSLALDRLTGFSLEMIRAVERLDDVVLELKTKTLEIENLLSIPAPENVVVSWSLNSVRNAETEDAGAPPVEARLEAARRCLAHGYLTAFHFDPLIHSPSWQEDYRRVVEALFDIVDPARIVYISLGGLRFPPSMKPLIEERFPQSRITSGELVRSWDGKLRYFRSIRVEMYRRMVEWIRARAPDVTIYLCMESPQVWQDVFGWSPERVRDVAEYLDAGCRKAKLARRAMRAPH